MTRGGRPLRFLALVISGWIGLRVVLLWPQGATLPEAIRAALPVAAARAETPRGVARPVPVPPVAWTAIDTPRTPPSVVSAAAMVPVLPPHHAAVDSGRVQLALLALVRFGAVGMVQVDPLPVPPPVPPDKPHATVSLWALARPGAATGGPVQLGGGQAGMRMRVPVRVDSRAALSARLSSPLSGPGREAALGVEWRPFDAPVPVALVIERRMALDHSGSGTGIGAIAGFDRANGLAGFDLEAYGQAGAVARAGIEPYADGALRGLRPVATLGRAVVKLGVGGWGGAQRGASRIDVGPSAVLALPIGGKPVRLSIDWRQRVAGNAAPGSGPAVTLGSDF